MYVCTCTCSGTIITYMYSMYVPCIEQYAHVHNNYLPTNCHTRDIRTCSN